MKDEHPITIEQVKEFDPSLVSALDVLIMQLDPNLPRLTEEMLRRVIQNPNVYLLIARDIQTKEVLGMLTLAVSQLLEGGKGSIEDVVVDEKLRGRGVGQRLTIAAIDQARELGLDAVGLTSRPARVAANKMYQKLGFVQRETNVYKYTIT